MMSFEPVKQVEFKPVAVEAPKPSEKAPEVIKPVEVKPVVQVHEIQKQPSNLFDQKNELQAMVERLVDNSKD
jgi:hypothetical protein